MSAVLSAKKRGTKNSIARMKTAYPLVLRTNLAIELVFVNAVLDEDYRFFIFLFLNPLKYVLTPIPLDWVFIGYA